MVMTVRSKKRDYLYVCVFFFYLFWKVCLNFFDSIYSVLFILFLIWNEMMCQVIGLWLSSYPPFSFRRFTKLTTYIIQFNSAAQSCPTLHQASLSITNSRSLPKLMSIESVIPSNHLNPLSSSSPTFNLS